MDDKTVFVRTVKGEDEMENRASRLSVDVKRALLMVDEKSTFGEIYKRAAPSMRTSLSEMFQELERGGYIQDRALLDKSRSSEYPRMSMPTHMVVPPKTVTPPQSEAGEGDLDFMSGYVAPQPASAGRYAEQLKAEEEEKAKQTIEAERKRAQREAEAILRKAEQEAARIREETARSAREEAEAAKQKAEQQAKMVREEMEAARLKAEQETKARLDAAAQERQKAEATRLAAEQEAARIREETARSAREEAEAAKQKAEQQAKMVRKEMEAARLKAEQEARARLDAAAKERQKAEATRLAAEQEAARIREETARRAREAAEAAKQKAEQQARKMREEMEAARLKAEQETKARLDAAAKERQKAEATRLAAEQEAARIREETARRAREAAEAAKQKAEQQARKMREEMEAAKLKVEQETKARLDAAAKERQKAEQEAAKIREETTRRAREEAEAIKQKAEQQARMMREELEAARSNAEQEALESAQPAPARNGGFAFETFDVQTPEEQVLLKLQAGELAQPRETVESEPVSAPPQAEVVHEPAKPVTPPITETKGPGEEELKQQEQERLVAEQAKELANAQAKVWAEAEQRVLEQAKANMEQVVQQAEQSAEYKEVEKLIPSMRTKKPFSWGRLVGITLKLGIALLVLLVIALFVLPYVLPMRDYMPKVQQLMSARLQQPVHLGHLSGRILPTPRLELGEIFIGDAKQLQAEHAYLDFPLTALFGKVMPINLIELQGVKVKGTSLKNVADWLQQVAADRQYPVAHMSISKGALDADVFEITGIEGELDFDPSGKFTKASLRGNGGVYLLGLSAAPDNKLQINFAVRGGALPLLPNWQFDDLSAKGMLSGDELKISDFDSRILGGVMQGSTTINWRSGWQVQGDLNAKTITMQKLDALLDGNVEGSARFKMAAANLADLVESVMLEGSFLSKDGVIGGMDVVETARLQSKENLPGGRTRYDTLDGVLAYANNAYHFKQVKLVSNTVNATANFDVSKRQLSGKMNVKLTLRDATGAVELKLGGAIDSPTLRYER